MDSLQDKTGYILEHEAHFAALLAAKVMKKPQMHIWMILIPMIFVFYLNDLKKYKDGKAVFAENYLLTKKRALHEAAESIRNGNDADLERLVSDAGLPEEAAGHFQRVLAILMTHYADLLQAEGDDFAALVRAAYENQHGYRLFIEELHEAEKKLNEALQADLQRADEGVGIIVRDMELFSEEIRNNMAREIFTRQP